MAQGSRICPNCGGLNGVAEKNCHRCGKNLPGPLSTSALGFLTDFSADGVPVTKLLIGLCLAVFAFCMAADGKLFPPLGIGGGSFRLSTMVRLGSLFSHPLIGNLASSEPWRMLSAVFMHFGLLHLGMNMLSFVSLGRTLEPHFRSARFAILFVLTGFVGFWVSKLWYGNQPNHTAGASGAIFGLIGAYSGALLGSRNPNWKRVLVNNLIFAAILGFILPANNAAHLGGFFAGFLLGLAFEKEPQPRKRDKLMQAVAAVCLLSSLASIVAATQSPIWKEFRRLEQQQE